MYGLIQDYRVIQIISSDPLNFEVIALFLFRLKEPSSVFYTRGSKFSSKINGKLSLSEKAAISSHSLFLSLHTQWKEMVYVGTGYLVAWIWGLLAKIWWCQVELFFPCTAECACKSERVGK